MPKIKEEGSTRILVLDYIPKTDKAFYDISDLDGRVIQTGSILSDDASIQLRDGLRSGRYLIYVVDGDEVAKGRFKVA